jgi:hypothetical protein
MIAAFGRGRAAGKPSVEVEQRLCAGLARGVGVIAAG